MTPQQVEWARCRVWFAELVKTNPFYTIEWIERQIGERFHFWAGKHGAVLTEYLEFETGRALNIFAAAGDPNRTLDEFLLEVEPSLTAWAKASECRWVIGFGRKGFERPFKANGYRHLWTVLIKDIENDS